MATNDYGPAITSLSSDIANLRAVIEALSSHVNITQASVDGMAHALGGAVHDIADAQALSQTAAAAANNASRAAIANALPTYTFALITLTQVWTLIEMFITLLAGLYALYVGWKKIKAIVVLVFSWKGDLTMDQQRRQTVTQTVQKNFGTQDYVVLVVLQEILKRTGKKEEADLLRQVQQAAEGPKIQEMERACQKVGNSVTPADSETKAQSLITQAITALEKKWQEAEKTRLDAEEGSRERDARIEEYERRGREAANSRPLFWRFPSWRMDAESHTEQRSMEEGRSGKSMRSRTLSPRPRVSMTTL